MKAIVVGGAGFIGSHLCEHLIKEGHQVCCVDNYSMGNEKQVKNIIGIEGFELKEADASDAEAIDKIFEEFKPEYVFHLAANSDIQASAKNPEIEYRNTYTTTFHILSCMRKYGVKHLFFFLRYLE